MNSILILLHNIYKQQKNRYESIPLRIIQLLSICVLRFTALVMAIAIITIVTHALLQVYNSPSLNTVYYPPFCSLSAIADVIEGL